MHQRLVAGVGVVAGVGEIAGAIAGLEAGVIDAKSSVVGVVAFAGAVVAVARVVAQKSQHLSLAKMITSFAAEAAVIAAGILYLFLKVSSYRLGY